MLKSFLQKPILKKIFFFLLFLLLFIYHCIRYYVLGLDCNFIEGKLNTVVEGLFFPVGLLLLLFNIIQLIIVINNKNCNWILINGLIFVTTIGLGLIFFNNTFLECFLHGADLNGIFLPH